MIGIFQPPLRHHGGLARHPFQPLPHCQEMDLSVCLPDHTSHMDSQRLALIPTRRPMSHRDFEDWSERLISHSMWFLKAQPDRQDHSVGTVPEFVEYIHSEITEEFEKKGLKRAKQKPCFSYFKPCPPPVVCPVLTQMLWLIYRLATKSAQHLLSPLTPP